NDIHHICERGKAQLKSETAIDQKWTSLFNENFISSVQDHFAISDKNLLMNNITLHTFSEEPQYYDVEIATLRIMDDLFYIGNFKNKTAVNNLYNFLAENEKLITSSSLAAGLVHEIRNPLTSLKGFLQLLEAGITQREKYYKVMIGE